MHCIHCGAQLPDGAKFCTSCGARIDTVPAAPVQESASSTPAPETCPPAAEPTAPTGSASVANQLPASYSAPSHSSSQAKTGYTVPVSQPSNDMAIAGFICSLILIPVFPIGILTSIVGFILSLIGLSNAKKLPSRKGHGLALAGTIISVIRIALRIIVLIFFITLLLEGAGQVGHNLISNWSEIMPYNAF